MTDGFVVKDSGRREEFETGAKRDTQEGKPRFDLIPILPLFRVAMLYTRGAKKYDEWNWAKGMSFSRFFASALRHLFAFAIGLRDEDHLAAVVFNTLAIMHFQELSRTDLDDMQSRIPGWAQAAAGKLIPLLNQYAEAA